MILRKGSVLLAAGLVILISCYSALAQKSGHRVTERVPALKAKITTIDTEQLKTLLKRDSKKPLLVNFWATWCDPCRDEFPDLVKLDAQYRPKGLEFIAITLDDLAELNTGVPKFLREMRAEMPNYLLNVPDPEPAIAFVDPKWGGALPATFLYNAEGEVVYKTFGRVKVPELRTAIEKVISKDPKSNVQGPASTISDE